jgi:hypothetical protein
VTLGKPVSSTDLRKGTWMEKRPAPLSRRVFFLRTLTDHAVSLTACRRPSQEFRIFYQIQVGGGPVLIFKQPYFPFVSAPRIDTVAFCPVD